MDGYVDYHKKKGGNNGHVRKFGLATTKFTVANNQSCRLKVVLGGAMDGYVDRHKKKGEIMDTLESLASQQPSSL